jgi:hypothetical protein
MVNEEHEAGTRERKNADAPRRARHRRARRPPQGRLTALVHWPTRRPCNPGQVDAFLESEDTPRMIEGGWMRISGRMTPAVVLLRLFVQPSQRVYNFARGAAGKSGCPFDVTQFNDHCANRLLPAFDWPVIGENQLIFFRFFRIRPVT